MRVVISSVLFGGFAIKAIEPIESDNPKIRSASVSIRGRGCAPALGCCIDRSPRNGRYLVFRRRNFHSLESPPLTRSYGLNWSRGTGSAPKGWLPRQISHSRGWTTRYWKRGARLLVYTSRTLARRLLPLCDQARCF